MKRARLPLFVLLLALMAAPAFGDSPQESDPPGTGVICAWAFMVVTVEVGRQCFPGQDADFQAEMAGYVSRFDDYVIRNGGATPADITSFKTKQGHVGDARDAVCRGDALKLYEGMRAMKPEARRAMVDDLLAKPGEPTWGTCT